MYYTVAKEEHTYTGYKPNDALQLKHMVFLKPEASIEHLVDLPREQLDGMLAGLKADELIAFEELQAAAANWDAVCATRLLVQEAIRYQTTPTRTHTNNVWTRVDMPGGGFSESISNSTYIMSVEAYPPANRSQSQWHVTWDIWFNCPKDNGIGKHTWVAGYRDKRLPNRDAAVKYIEGRKKAYAKLFQEEYPPVPAKAAALFKIGNKLMQGYTVSADME